MRVEVDYAGDTLEWINGWGKGGELVYLRGGFVNHRPHCSGDGERCMC